MKEIVALYALISGIVILNNFGMTNAFGGPFNDPMFPGNPGWMGDFHNTFNDPFFPGNPGFMSSFHQDMIGMPPAFSDFLPPPPLLIPLRPKKPRRPRRPLKPRPVIIHELPSSGEHTIQITTKPKPKPNIVQIPITDGSEKPVQKPTESEKPAETSKDPVVVVEGEKKDEEKKEEDKKEEKKEEEKKEEEKKEEEKKEEKKEEDKKTPTPPYAINTGGSCPRNSCTEVTAPKIKFKEDKYNTFMMYSMNGVPQTPKTEKKYYLCTDKKYGNDDYYIIKTVKSFGPNSFSSWENVFDKNGEKMGYSTHTSQLSK